MGWRIDSGFRQCKANLVLDYESVRTNAKGYGKLIQVHTHELVVPENHIFPLFQAEQAKVEGGSGVLPKISMPFEQGAPTTPSRTRKTYVTLDRAIRFGKTVGVRHSEACHKRFRSLIKGKGPVVKSISNPESNCLPMWEMIVLLGAEEISSKRVSEWKCLGKFLCIQMIGSATSIKESRPKVG